MSPFSSSSSDNSTAVSTTAHLVAMPWPGRGHINPMLNLCKLLLLASETPPQLMITFVVTQEWRGFLSSETLPPNIRFGTLPQVIPSEIGRARDFHGFLEAALTKLQAPFEDLLDRFHPPPSAILYDTHLTWVTAVANSRNIPVASLYPMSASVFTVLSHFDLLVQNGHYPADVAELGNERVDYIPGLPATTIGDLPSLFHGVGQKTMHRALEMASSAPNVNYLLLTSLHELEPLVIDALKSKLSIPIYPIGPLIPYHNLAHPRSAADETYFQWLDSQPESSVLYVSMGSFLSVSDAQMEEIVAGIQDSGVRYMWVTRGDTSRFKEDDAAIGERAFLVPWCDQLKVLCHPSIGGFWTHCGWNSTWEGVYAGVPMLTYPIFWDQGPNSKMIVDDWKIGRRGRKTGMWVEDVLTTREEIAEAVRGFMDLESDERKEMVKRAKELQQVCKGAVAPGGSAASNFDAFLKDIMMHAVSQAPVS
ncbi:UDP-glycosyltransferase 87A2-like protein [Drosera capensis]